MPVFQGPGGYYASGSWSVNSNVWNPSGLVYGQDYTQTVTFDPTNPNLGFRVDWAFDWTRATTLGSYSQPNLIFGSSPFNGFGRTAEPSGLPLKVNQITSAEVSWNADWSTGLGFNINIDLRLVSRTGDGLTSITDDIIIWIHEWGRPLGSNTGQHAIDGVGYSLWVERNVPFNGGTNVDGLTFVAQGDMKAGVIDLADFFAVLKAQGLITGEEYLFDVLIGPEITNGTGYFQAEYFNVSLNGAGDYVAAGQTQYHATVADDHIYLYGDARGASPGVGVTAGQTHTTTVVIALNGTIINGAGPTVEVQINGVSYGRTTLTPQPSEFVDGAGLRRTVMQDLVINVPGLTRIQDLKVSMVEPAAASTPNAAIFIQSARVNGVDLRDAITSFPSGGSAPHQIGVTSNFNGSETIDAAPWNRLVAGGTPGSLMQPIVVDGEGGRDTVHVLGLRTDYTISAIGPDQFALREVAGLGQNAYLSGIRTLQFADGQALDLATLPAANLASSTQAGGAGADSLLGAAGQDTITGGAGNDTISDVAAANYLRGEDGNDSIVGGAGFDDINGNMGNDTAAGGVGQDWVVGGKDHDLLFGGADYDLVYGNLGNDTCEGGDGNDIVRGGQQDDVINGGAGDDYMSGDRDNDTISGGSGADAFHSFGDAGIDRILDFNRAEGDRVLLDPGTSYSVAQSGADTVVSMGGGGQVILVGVSMSSLTGNWITVG